MIPGSGLCRAVLACAFLPLVLACSGDRDERPEPVPVSIPATHVHTFDALEVVERIIDIRVHADTQILILNSASPHLLLFDSAGAVAAMSGASGGGPGELQRPMALLGSDASGIAWIYDAGKRSLIGVDPTGIRPPLAELRLPTDGLPPSSLLTTEAFGTLLGRPWMETGDSAILVARSRLPFGGPLALRLWQAELVSLGHDGSVRPILAMTDHLPGPLEKFGGTGEYLPYPLWARCDTDDVIVLYDPLKHSLRRFSMRGEETAAVGLPPARRLPMTRDGYWEMLLPALIRERRDTAAFRATFNASWRDAAGTMSSVFPEYVDLHCSSGIVWLQQFDQTGLMGHGRSWTAVGPDGSLRSYTFPPDFRPLRFTSERIWGVVTDDLGVEAVAWLSISVESDLLDLP